MIPVLNDTSQNVVVDALSRNIPKVLSPPSSTADNAVAECSEVDLTATESNQETQLEEQRISGKPVKTKFSNEADTSKTSVSIVRIHVKKYQFCSASAVINTL